MLSMLATRGMAEGDEILDVDAVTPAAERIESLGGGHEEATSRRVVSESGPDHEKYFITEITVGG